MVNAKRKGSKGENEFAAFLRENGVKAYRDSASGGSVHKGDIISGLQIGGINALFEVKTVKRLNHREAFEQAQRDASKSHAVPVLATHYNGMRKGEWLITLHSEDFIALVHEAGSGINNSP